jgi:hypothetical protein
MINDVDLCGIQLTVLVARTILVNGKAHSINKNRNRVDWEERRLHRDECEDVQSVWVCYE